MGVLPPLADHRERRPVDCDLDFTPDTVVPQVISGLGGVGKTQLAADLAHRLWQDRQVDLLVWVPATSRSNILTTYAQAAAAVTGLDDDTPAAAARLLAWLANTERPWLIVLDDLTDPADLTGLWPPISRWGRTLATTRRRDAALLTGRHLVEVGVFTSAEAERYLNNKLGDRPGRLEEADALATDLGCLPLALAQAAAYLGDQQGLTCSDYRRRLAERRLDRLAPHALPDDHAQPVVETWSMSIDLADRLDPVGLASPVLELAALLDPHAIPAALFTTDAVLGYCATRLDRPLDADDLRDAVQLLHRFNLVSFGSCPLILDT